LPGLAAGREGQQQRAAKRINLMHPDFANEHLRHDFGLPGGAAISEVQRNDWRAKGGEAMAQLIWNGHVKFRAERGIQTAPGREGFPPTIEEYDKPKLGTFIPSPSPANETDAEKALRVSREETDHFAATVRREAGIDAKPGVPLDHGEYLAWRKKQSWAPR
jgi:hypothetical protein